MSRQHENGKFLTFCSQLDNIKGRFWSTPGKNWQWICCIFRHGPIAKVKNKFNIWHRNFAQNRKQNRVRKRFKSIDFSKWFSIEFLIFNNIMNTRGVVPIGFHQPVKTNIFKWFKIFLKKLKWFRTIVSDLK